MSNNNPTAKRRVKIPIHAIKHGFEIEIIVRPARGEPYLKSGTVDGFPWSSSGSGALDTIRFQDGRGVTPSFTIAHTHAVRLI